MKLTELKTSLSSVENTDYTNKLLNIRIKKSAPLRNGFYLSFILLYIAYLLSARTSLGNIEIVHHIVDYSASLSDSEV